MKETAAEQYARIGKTLYPTDPTYCAEPLDIEDSRFLYQLIGMLTLNGKAEWIADASKELINGRKA